ncbi:NUDIX domain-containing protein [bacterium]|nr:NUDIX domain-containing protein [bacterium]
MSPNPRRLVVRVYGLLLNAQQQVLTVSETYQGLELHKFPGGGLEWGEGLLDCVQREFREETGWDIPFQEHFYTTDFFQPSAFGPHDQILSVYYLCSQPFRDNALPGSGAEQGLTFRWSAIEPSLISNLTLPIDQVVAQRLVALLGRLG